MRIYAYNIINKIGKDTINDGGIIFFGVDDDGNVKGLPDVKQACLDIENKINDSISLQPNYNLLVDCHLE